jgi:hypothetical protein
MTRSARVAELANRAQTARLLSAVAHEFTGDASFARRLAVLILCVARRAWRAIDGAILCSEFAWRARRALGLSAHIIELANGAQLAEALARQTLEAAFRAIEARESASAVLKSASQTLLALRLALGRIEGAVRAGLAMCLAWLVLIRAARTVIARLRAVSIRRFARLAQAANSLAGIACELTRCAVRAVRLTIQALRRANWAWQTF